MKKRVLSLLLMLVMVVTAVPCFAFSASAETVVKRRRYLIIPPFTSQTVSFTVSISIP